MTTPNIVPRFNEEGRVGRVGRRFTEVHGKKLFSDQLILNIPSAESIIQATDLTYSFDIGAGAQVYNSLSALQSVHGSSLTESDASVVAFDPTGDNLVDYSTTPITFITSNGWPGASLSQTQFEALISHVNADTTNFPSGMPDVGDSLFIYGVGTQVYPPQHHMFYQDGRLHHGSKTLAWTSEVTEIKVLVDSLLGDGSDGLSTLLTQLQSLPELDSFVEVVNQVKTISDDYVTSADIGSLSDITTLNSKVATLETDSASHTTTLGVHTTNINANAANVATLTTNQNALLTFKNTDAATLFAPKGVAGVGEFVSDITGTNLTNLIDKLKDTGLGTSYALALNSDVHIKGPSDFTTSFDANIPTSNLLSNVALSTAVDSKLTTASLLTELGTVLTSANRITLDLPTQTDISNQVTALNLAITNNATDIGLRLLDSDFDARFVSKAASESLVSSSTVDTMVTTLLSSNSNGFLTSSTLDSALSSSSVISGLITSSSLDSALNSSSVISGLVTSSSLSSTLGDYLLTSDLNTSLTSASAFSALSTSVSTNATDIAALPDSAAVSAAVTAGVAGLLQTANLSSAIDSVISDSSSGLATQLTAKLNASAFDSSFNSAVSSAGLATQSYVTGLGYQTASDVTSSIDSLNLLPTASLATEFSNLLTTTNLASSGSMGALTSLVEATSEEIAEEATKQGLAQFGMTLDTTQINWSAYTLDVGSFNITSNFTFQCADPNIELNVGNPTAYLTEVEGGITWVRADDAHNSAILWNESGKYFHVRLAGADTYRLLTIQDLTSLQNEISNASSTQSTAIQTVQSNLDQAISTESSSRLSADTALQEAIDTEAVLRANAITSVQASIDSESASRIASDTAIQNSIISEQSARSVADNQLSNQISDLEDKVDANTSTLTSSISSLETATNTKIAADISTSANAINSRVDSEIQSASSTLDTRISTEVGVLEAADTANKQELEQSISALSTTVAQHISASNPYSITKDTVGLGSVQNIDVDSWEGSNSITTVGTISSGEWSATPITSIATSAIKPAHIDSTETTAYTVQNLNVLGQLNVSGDAVQVTTNEVNIGDNIIRLNADVTGTPSENSGIEVERGSEDNVSLLWDEGNDRWSIGGNSLETSGLASNETITIDSPNVQFSGSVSVPHLDIISNFSFQLSGGMMTVNTDAREPSYPKLGYNSDGASTAQGNQVVTYATTDTTQAANDSGIKVVLGGGYTSVSGANGPRYAFLFWDASVGRWRLTESGAVTSEKIEASDQATEIVDTSMDNHFDLLHAGHIGSSLQTGNVSAAQIQPYSAGLFEIADLTAGSNTVAENSFIVRGSSGWIKKTSAEVNTLLGSVLLTGNQTVAGTKTFSSTIQGSISGNAATATEATQAANLNNHNTDDLAEGTNLYYTDARVDTRIATIDTDSLSEGSSNLYYTNARADARIAAATTSDLTEGSNLYYTDARADARADIRIAAADTDSLSEGSSNLYYTDARARGSISENSDQLAYNSTTGVLTFTQGNTDTVSEGSSNLYYTDARAQSAARGAISENSTQLSYNSSTGVLTYTQGDTDTVSEGSSNLYYTDTRARAAISENSTQLAYNSTTGVLTYTQGDTDTVSEGSNNLYYTDARADARIASADTDDLSEGSNNLYYTDARARAAISENSTQLAYNSSTGVLTFTQGDTDTVSEGSSNLYYTDARADARIAAADTDDVSEGSSNLYFTNARADARIAAADTGDLAEGSNLYFTNARADARIAAATTDDLSEGSSNLYTTAARTRSHISATGDLAYNSTTGVFSYSTPTARTDAQVNSLADARIAASSINALSDVTFTADPSLDNYILTYDHSTGKWSAEASSAALSDTDDLSEGSTNLYFTNARADARIAAADTDDLSEGSSNLYYTDARADARIAAADTDDLSEGSSNLYHTEARARAAISENSTQLSYNSSTGVLTYTQGDTDTVSEGSSNLYHTEARVRNALTAGDGLSFSGGEFSIDADQSSNITKIDVASLFAKGSGWDATTTTSGSDTSKTISLGYTTDSHTGPWNVTRQTKRDGSDLAYMEISYKISSGVEQYKSLPDLNFTLTSSSSGGDTTHTLTLA